MWCFVLRKAFRLNCRMANNQILAMAAEVLWPL